MNNALAAALLLMQLNGAEFTRTFSPELLQDASRAEAQQENPRLTELKERLKAEFEPATIDSLFSHREFGMNQDIPKQFRGSAERRTNEGRMSYEEYRKHHGLEYLIKMAPIFLEKYNGVLEGVEKRYGTDKRVIVIMWGIESSLAEKGPIGDYKALNALVSQYVLMPKRRGWAYKEIKALINYSQRSGMPVFVSSSHAGAIGIGQFVPSSLLRYFVGKNGNFKDADPNDLRDTFYSMGYYLKENGWNPSKNETIPQPGLGNWKSICSYNPNSIAYAMLVSEGYASLLPNVSSEQLHALQTRFGELLQLSQQMKASCATFSLN